MFSLADIFVFPSWIEGFGIPLLEAMTCGAPVVASDRGAIPEVAGGAALLMDAEDDFTLAGHIIKLLSDPVEVGRMRKLGFQQAQKYSWTLSACQTLKVYEKLVG
jgi:glycosyltransferase involved in cell wall biosynthesis